MKNKGQLFFLLFIVALFVLARTTCNSSDGNNTGYEYMPDMAHSIAYEANTDNYYYHNTWSDDSTYHAMAAPRKPVKGTIPRGYAGLSGRTGEAAEAVAANLQGTPMNSFVPYYYEDTEEERARAMAEITSNPYKYISESEMAQGKVLYNTFCGICHGEKGDGNGYLVSEENKNAKYPAAPSNYLTEEFVNATDGRYYHAIMYGKNVMGGYKDKMNYKERWLVIHYIRSLQAKDQKQEYGFVYKDGELPGVDAEANVASFNLDAASQLLEDAISASEAGTDGEDVEIDEIPALILENVLFETGSSVLKTSSYRELNVLTTLLKEFETVKIQINGHTDNVGNVANNMKLSESRAKSVFDYLVGHGIAEDRLTFKGFADSKPISSNDTEEGKKRNRRTDITVQQ